MKVVDSYYIKRDEDYIWLSQGIEPLETDEIVEVRPMLVADEGKTLVRDGVEIGGSLWLKDGDVAENYQEIDIPPFNPDEEPEEEDVQEG